MWSSLKKRSIVIYPFKGSEILPTHGLDLDFGDVVEIKALLGEWYFGTKIKNEETEAQFGLFPHSFVQIQLPEDAQDEICLEVANVAKKWFENYKRIYVDQGHSSYQASVVDKAINEIIEWRKILINETLTKDEVYDLKSKIANKIDWGNRKLGLDLIPREGFEVIDDSKCGIVQLHQYHAKSVEQSSNFNTLGRKKKSNQNLPLHLHLSLKEFSYNANEDPIEFYFSLYDARKGAFITEKYLVKYQKEGTSSFIEKLYTSCIFEDLNNELADLYIVSQVYRIGRMLNESGNRKNGQMYKRPFASAVLSILDNSGSEFEEGSELKYYTCDEKEFYQIHEFIIKKQMGKVSLNSAFSLITLKLFYGEIEKIRNENPIIKNSTRVQKIGFPDIILPGLIRNDLYITIECGEFDKAQKSIEISLLVIDKDGNWVPNSVFGAAVQSLGFVGSDNYKSVVYLKNNAPRWNETVKIVIPLEKFQDCHIRLEYRNCSTKKSERKLFGFSFLNLMDNKGTAVADRLHELNVFKCEDHNKLIPSTYLSLDSFMTNVNSGNSHFQRTKESLQIRTFLVSTKFTQNSDLVSLLKHKSCPENLPTALEKLTKLNGGELVKFLQDVLDVLFEIFSDDDGNSTEFSGHVFSILVNIFRALDDSKFKHFKKTLDAYLNFHFSAALVYKGLLSSIRHYAKVLTIAGAAEKKHIQECFLASEYLFKVVVESQLLFSKATGGGMEDSFQKDLDNLFFSLGEMMQADGESETQSCLALDKMYKELIRILPKSKVTLLVVQIFANIPLRDSAHPLSPWKLRALEHLVNSELITDRASRTEILREVCRHLRHHFSHREELLLLCKVFNSILVFLRQDKDKGNDINNDIQMMTSILQPLIQAILILEKNSVVNSLIICLFGIIELMNESHFNNLWDDFSERKVIRDFILRFIFVFRDIIKLEIFPDYWFSLQINIAKIMLNSLEEIAKAIVVCVKYDAQLWSQYFSLLVIFVTQPALSIEKFDKGKRTKVLERIGDLRIQMVHQFLGMWDNLGQNKIDYLGMVGQFLEMSLLPQIEIRRAIISKIFFDLMEAEQAATDEFRQVESELTDKLDILIGIGQGDSEYMNLFKTTMTQKIRNCSYSWKLKGLHFVESISNLIERLLDYRENMETSPRLYCTVNLLNLYRKLSQDALYIRYIYKLHDLHKSDENYIEAGNTLLLHSEICRNEEEREEIYLNVLQYFDMGKIWESGITIIKELIHYYERTYSYEKLSQILQKMSMFYDKILQEYRPEVEYFRVGFFGQKALKFVRNKEFIYRGLEYEKIANFIQRILEEWPEGEVLGNTPIDDSIINGEGLYLQICSVKPLSSHPILKTKVSDRIKSFYLTNDVRVFQFDRRLQNVQNTEENNDNEFKNMWIERTILVSQSSFSGILKWFEVIDKQQEEITPIRYACERIDQVNKQLEELNENYKVDPGKNLNPLTMRLQGILDAAVMGGLPKYRDAFFNDGHQSVEVNKLRHLIKEQMYILDKSLKLHGQLVPLNLQPLHNRLLECFEQMKSLEGDFKLKSCSNFRNKENKSIINSPLPPLPKLSTNSNRSSLSSTGYGHIFANDDEDVYSHVEINSNYEGKNGHQPLSLDLSIPSQSSIDSSYRISNSSEYIVIPPGQIRGDTQPPPPPLPASQPPCLPPKKTPIEKILLTSESSSPPLLPKRQPKKIEFDYGSGRNSCTPPASPRSGYSNTNNLMASSLSSNSVEKDNNENNNVVPPIPPKKPSKNRHSSASNDSSESNYTNGDSSSQSQMNGNTGNNNICSLKRKKSNKEYYVLPSSPPLPPFTKENE